MKKKGITLIALVVTIVILIIISTVSIVIITEGNVVDKSKEIRKDDQIESMKETIRAVTISAIKEKKENANDLANFIHSELIKIKGFEDSHIYHDGNDYIVAVNDEVEISIEEATGKKLNLYIDSYVTRDEIDGR